MPFNTVWDLHLRIQRKITLSSAFDPTFSLGSPNRDAIFVPARDIDFSYLSFTRESKWPDSTCLAEIPMDEFIITEVIRETRGWIPWRQKVEIVGSEGESNMEEPHLMTGIAIAL